MRVIIRSNADEVGLWVATYIRDRINNYKPSECRPFVLGLPTGSSPLITYNYLIKFYREGLLSFANVITFNMDEYVALPRDHKESYHSFMWNNFFKHIDIKPSNVNILNGNAVDLKLECQQYEEKIKNVGGIELFLGGIGHDGHIAFNEPGSSLTSRTRVKTLAYETIIANARFFDNKLESVPTMALTVGVGTIMDSREVLIIVTGQAKSVALEKCIEQGVNHMWTLSAIQLHKQAVIACDDDATGELRVRTVRYFKGLEKVQDEIIAVKIVNANQNSNNKNNNNDTNNKTQENKQQMK
jgi:glucosamine-6-phosphate deaminase